MPGWGTIGTYHNNVASDVRAVLGRRVQFYSDVSGRGIRQGAEVGFELMYENVVESERALRVRREDGRPHRVWVFRLCTQSSLRVGTFWVSWHETWRKENPTNFVLLSAGWTVFEGLPGSKEKVQVLRVDWDQLPHRGGKEAGHPHWHFDHEVFISAELAGVAVAPDLVEIPSDAESRMRRRTSVGSIHLAMGAWNGGMDHPQCWQRTYGCDCEQLRDWCVKTLRYLKEQIGSE